jgi:hypothetical protein
MNECRVAGAAAAVSVTGIAACRSLVLSALSVCPPALCPKRFWRRGKALRACSSGHRHPCNCLVALLARQVRGRSAVRVVNVSAGLCQDLVGPLEYRLVYHSPSYGDSRASCVGCGHNLACPLHTLARRRR